MSTADKFRFLLPIDAGHKRRTMDQVFEVDRAAREAKALRHADKLIAAFKEVTDDGFTVTLHAALGEDNPRGGGGSITQHWPGYGRGVAIGFTIARKKDCV